MKIEIPTKKSIQMMIDEKLKNQAKEWYRILNMLKDRVDNLERRK